MVNLNDFDSTCMSVCLSVFMYSSEEFAWTNSNAIKKKLFLSGRVTSIVSLRNVQNL